MCSKAGEGARDGEGEGTVSALLVEFGSAVGEQVQAIEKALFDSEIAPPTQERTTPFNAEAAVDAIARLRILLEASDGDAEESFS